MRRIEEATRCLMSVTESSGNWQGEFATSFESRSCGQCGVTIGAQTLSDTITTVLRGRHACSIATKCLDQSRKTR